jgi:hypothetical protein
VPFRSEMRQRTAAFLPASRSRKGFFAMLARFLAAEPSRPSLVAFPLPVKETNFNESERRFSEARHRMQADGRIGT